MEIKECDRVIQFAPDNGESFYVQVRQGKFVVTKGNEYSPDYKWGLYVTGNQESMNALFDGEMSVGESMYNHRIQIPGFRNNKEPMVVWFSKLLQEGVKEKA